VPRAATGPNDLDTAGTIVNRFAVDLLHREADGKNLVFSPTSIVTALAMARAGARGTTAAEMDQVLHDGGLDPLLGAVNALDQALAGRSSWVLDQNTDPPTSHEVALRSVNASFAQAGYPLEKDYLDVLAARFGAGLRLVDYRADPNGARQLINGWVSDRTEQRIKELLKEPDVTGLTRLILVNAVYLKAPWRDPFRPKDTRSGRFTRADGSTVTVPMMHLESTNTGPTFPAATGEGWVAVRLPYMGEQFAMTIMVPDDLKAFEKRLDAGMLTKLTQQTWERDRQGVLEDNRVVLTLPKFSIASDTNLKDVLEAMGMPTAFDLAAADFTGIANPDRTGEPGLYIAKVIHQANIDVDEKGTEAAAATAIVMATAGPGDQRTPIVVRADHPFLFVLTDVASGTVLFIGRVADPAAG
jgi:serpin B